MSFDFISVLIGAGVGSILSMIVFTGPDSKIGNKVEQYNSAIKLCEAELPRDKHCVITAKVFNDEDLK